MSTEERAGLLNASQRRHLSVTLKVLEELLRTVEKAFLHGYPDGILFGIEDNLPAAGKDKILQEIAAIHAVIASVVGQFALEREDIEASRTLVGKSTYAWLILQEAKARRLKGYGMTAEGLEAALDPQIEAMLAGIRRIEELARGPF